MNYSRFQNLLKAEVAILHDQDLLGEIICQLKGKVMSYRILDEESQKVETSISGEASVRGQTSLLYLLTYWSVPRSPGLSYSEGKGMLFSLDGSQIISWKGYSMGRYYQNGARKADKGAVFFLTSSTNDLTFLNNIFGITEYELDAHGNSNGKIWEWK